MTKLFFFFILLKMLGGCFEAAEPPSYEETQQGLQHFNLETPLNSESKEIIIEPRPSGIPQNILMAPAPQDRYVIMMSDPYFNQQAPTVFLPSQPYPQAPDP